MSFQKEIKSGIVASHRLAKQNSLKRKNKFSQWQSEHWCAQTVLCLIFQHGGHVIQFSQIVYLLTSQNWVSWNMMNKGKVLNLISVRCWLFYLATHSPRVYLNMYTLFTLLHPWAVTQHRQVASTCCTVVSFFCVSKHCKISVLKELHKHCRKTCSQIRGNHNSLAWHQSCLNGSCTQNPPPCGQNRVLQVEGIIIATIFNPS